MRALRTAASGMSAQQLNVEVISNNLANLNTVGYKRQRAQFQDLLYQEEFRTVNLVFVLKLFKYFKAFLFNLHDLHERN
jgi:flagellar hook-basal body protein